MWAVEGIVDLAIDEQSTTFVLDEDEAELQTEMIIAEMRAKMVVEGYKCTPVIIRSRTTSDCELQTEGTPADGYDITHTTLSPNTPQQDGAKEVEFPDDHDNREQGLPRETQMAGDAPVKGEEQKSIKTNVADTSGEGAVQQSLILFEEVDILFKDDVNFWPTVIDFVANSRRPVILTCNGKCNVFSLRTYFSTPIARIHGPALLHR